MAHERVLATRRSFGWIQKYIFPGGLIPSLQAIDDTLAAHTTLRVTQRRELRRALRPDPAPVAGTLHRAVAAHRSAQGFDETFRRMWEFYLAYSRGRLPQRLPRRQPAAADPGAGVDLNGKVAWVVGASSGIGAAVARELVAAARPSRSRPAARSSSSRSPAGACSSSPLDVTDAASVAAAAARVRDELGRIDVAVLAAGYWRQMDPAGLGHRGVRPAHPGQPRRDEQRHRGRAAARCCERGSGVIAGIASVAGYRGLAGAEAYGATKAAQINLLESLRVHVARSRGAGDHDLPGLRPHRAHRRQPLPHAVHHRRRPGRPSRSATASSVTAPRSSSPRGWRC